MRRYKKTFTLFLLLTMMIPYAKSQELNYSMYHHAPLATNPGIMGTQKEMKVSLNYRNQAVDIGKNFRSSMLSVFSPVGIRRHTMVVAGSFVNDRASDYLVTNGGLVALSYSVSLSPKSELSLGIQFGYFQRKTAGDFVTEEQFVNGVYDPTIPSTDVVLNYRKNYSSLSHGLYWQLRDEREDTKAMFGVSVFNATEPELGFSEHEDRLPLSVKMIAGYTIYSGMKLSVMPTVRWIHQANNNYFNIGSRLSYELTGRDETRQIALGLWYSPSRVGIASLEFSQPYFTLAVSYDFPVSSKMDSPQKSVVELAVLYRIKRKSEHAE